MSRYQRCSRMSQWHEGKDIGSAVEGTRTPCAGYRAAYGINVQSARIEILIPTYRRPASSCKIWTLCAAGGAASLCIPA